LVPYPAPSSSSFSNDTEMISGMPARMNSSASVKLRNRVTYASRPYSAAYAVLNGQLPAPS
jgi:hypothetical protein